MSKPIERNTITPQSSNHQSGSLSLRSCSFYRILVIKDLDASYSSMRFENTRVRHLPFTYESLRVEPSCQCVNLIVDPYHCAYPSTLTVL
jgi:hypothetical protein